MTPLHDLTIRSFHDGLVNKKFSALEVTQAFFRQIKKANPSINAYLDLHEESALRQAEEVDLTLARGESVGDLAGVPLAIKDNILIKGKRATAASKILENYTASYDAYAIKKLRAEKSVFLGKTNLDEFAMGSSTENSAFGTTKNPRDLRRVPGGSSGGSAAAVAAQMALAALGTDTGGSIRQPAGFCGVVGLKPTYGAVSRSGLIAMSSSLDQIGPITKTVEDAAIMFRAIAGEDPMDSTSSSHDYDNDDALSNPKLENLKRIVVGLPEEYFAEGLSREVSEGVDLAVKKINSLGLQFKKISLPHSRYALSCYYIVMPAEVGSNLARFDGIRYARVKGQESGVGSLQDIYLKQRGLGFGSEVKRRIILGTFVLSSGYYDAYYEKAQRVRALIKKDFEEAFKEVDVILAPTSPTPPFMIGEKADDPLTMYLSDVFTIPVNLAGLPAISIPVGSDVSSQMSDVNLPVGFQLVGKWWREKDILGLGQYYEKLV